MEILQNCQHEIEDGICQLCGLMMDNLVDSKLEFTKNCPRISSGKSNIIDNLDGIPMEVISRAKSNITEKETLTGKKVRNDTKNTFVEIYAAYLECGYSDFNPQKLAKKLKLSRKDINWCLKTASGTALTSNFVDESFNYASIVIISPVAYIDTKCKKNNLEEYKDKLIEIATNILEKKDILYSSRPEYVACAIIKKFCELNNINIKCFSSINEISDNALKKCMSDIKEFDHLFHSN